MKTVAPKKPLPSKRRMDKLVKSLAKLVDSENESICLVCDINCKSSEGLQDHKNGKQFLCRICTLVFDDHSTLESHFICHNKFKCKLCDNLFLTNNDYLQHKNSRENCIKETKNRCEHCGKVYLRLKSWQYHIQHFHTDISYLCGVCGRSFDKMFRLVAHEMTVHLAYEYMECEFCHRLLEGPEKLRTHVKLRHVRNPEEQAIFCTICAKSFDSRYGLKIHMGVHDSTEYSCNDCGKTVTGLERFKRHMNHQHKQGPFNCKVCQNVFPTEGKLYIHKKFHKKKKKKEMIGLFMCEICGKALKTRETFKAHQRTHSKDRPYQCDVCGATFKLSVALNTHGRVHSDITKYHCDNCGLGFKWKQTLEKHISKCVKDS